MEHIVVEHVEAALHITRRLLPILHMCARTFAFAALRTYDELVAASADLRSRAASRLRLRAVAFPALPRLCAVCGCAQSRNFAFAVVRDSATSRPQNPISPKP